MTTIIATPIELNERRDGHMIINGFDLSVTDAPALTGTEKQVAWAEKIRSKFLEAVVRIMTTHHGLTGPKADNRYGFPVDEVEGKVAIINADLARLAAKLHDRVAAKDWIEAHQSVSQGDARGMMRKLFN